MRIGLISDTHGSLAAIRRAVAAAGPVDLWLHAGDFSQDAAKLAQVSGRPVTAVAGNCDGATTYKIDEFIDAGGKKIWLTHGHRYRAKERPDELAWWAAQYEVDIVVYGHSHKPDLRLDGVILFNPGSAGYPRGGHPPTCGLLVIEDGRIDASLIEI